MLLRSFPVLVVCLLVASGPARGQEEGGTGAGGGPPASGLWERLRAMWNNMVQSFRQLWNEFWSEMRSRSRDVTAFTREAWQSWKEEMVKWLDARNDIGEAEKKDMREYIEKMEMPPPPSEQQKE